MLEASAAVVPAVDEKLPPVARHIGLLILGLLTKSRGAKFLNAEAALSAVLKLSAAALVIWAVKRGVISPIPGRVMPKGIAGLSNCVLQSEAFK